MKVTTVTASVRYSKAIGEGQHKTVELSADATLEPRDDWQEAQASLYQQLGWQLKTLWAQNGAVPSEVAQVPAPESHEHFCQGHQTEYKRFEKDGRVWYSHKTDDGKWCKDK